MSIGAGEEAGCGREAVINGAGWGRGSKYSVVGGLRAVAQTVSYEIVYSFLFLLSMVLVGYSILQRGVAV